MVHWQTDQIFYFQYEEFLFDLHKTYIQNLQMK